MTSSHAAAGPSGIAAPRRAYRASEGRLLGGVAAGLAQHLGLPTLWVRVALLALVAFGGLGAVLYAGLWLVLPAERHVLVGAPGLDAATRQGKRGGRRERKLTDYGPLVAVGAIAVGILLLVTIATGQTLAFGPLLLAAGGIAVLWWQADQAQRDRWQDRSGRLNPLRAVVGGGGAAAYARIVVGLLMLVSAIMLFSLRSGSIDVALNVGLAAALGILGLGFMVGPWLFRLSSDLSEEREARVRSEERADVAAHLHDSVLQTLALIQRSAGDGPAVSRLARAQERDLRSWLFADPRVEATTLAAALREAAAAVEDAHGVPV
jgi:phage shock protein PspC (stress-responsive transcriptional regulator)